MKSPFPWFGGKRRVAAQVWDAFGDVDNYVEPFAGSLAVLLDRPSHHLRRAETVNDADHFLANFWRALAHDPEGVAHACDWPVNEADLFARHLWLVNSGRERLASMDSDPDFYDVQVAGWWVWGINAWIGSGWCSGTGPWRPAASPPRQRRTGCQPAASPPRQRRTGCQPAASPPRRRRTGCQPEASPPRQRDAGRGVNRKRPHLGNAGQGRLLPVPRYRLARVRVCCGDWTRVVTTGALHYGATKGVLLDPPYLGDVRTSDLYAVDDHQIAHDAREWALAHGDDPQYRIVLCGYEPEHVDRMPASWRMVAYSASKSYGSSAGGGVNDENRHLERLWLSPHCVTSQGTLFGEAS